MAGEAKPLKVFVSYSRADVAFADQLVLALEDKGFEAILDRHDISGAENWRERLGKLILSGDAVTFVLTEKSATSEICKWEVREAKALGKRIIPITPGPLGSVTPPEELAELNWIPFYADPAIPGSGFYYGVVRLNEALSVDLEWLRAQTRYSERAVEWARQKTEDLLLRGEALREAEAWLARTPAGAHPPDRVREYLAASGDVEQHRQAAAKAQLQEREQALKTAEAAVAESRAAQHKLRRFSVWALVAGVVLLAIAIPGNYLAATRTLDVNDRRAVLFADAANDLTRLGDYNRALLMALAGDPPARTGLLESLMRPDGNLAVRKALARAYATDRTVAVVDVGMQYARRLIVLPDGKRFLTLSKAYGDAAGTDADVQPGEEASFLWIWTAEADPKPQKVKLPRIAEDIFPLADDDQVLIWWDMPSPKAFSVWSLKEGRIIRDLGPTYVEDEVSDVIAAVGYNKDWLAVAVDSRLTLWDIADGSLQAEQRLPELHDDDLRAIALSEDAERVTISISTGEVVVWDVAADKVLKPVESVFGDIDALVHLSSSTLIFGSDTAQIGDVDEEGILSSGLQAFAESIGGQGIAELRAADQRGILVLSTDGRVRMLDATTEGWVDPFGRRADLIDVGYLPAAAMMVGLTRKGAVLLTSFGSAAIPVHFHTLLGDAMREGKTYSLIREFGYSTAGAMAIETEDRRLVVWNAMTNGVDAYPAPADMGRPAAHLSVTGDGGTAFRSGGHLVEVWKRGATTPVVHTLLEKTDIIMRLQALGDGSAFMFSSYSDKAGVIRSDTGDAIIGPVAIESGPVFASPDGRTMMQIREDGSVQVIHAGEVEWQTFRGAGQWMEKPKEADTRPVVIAFSSDGETLAMGLRNGSVEMWRKGGVRPFQSFKGHVAPVLEIAFQPDGPRFATMGADGRVQVWEQGGGEPLQTFELKNYAARALAVPPGGREILVVEEESLFRLPLSPIILAGVDEQMKLACARLQERGVAGFSDQDYVDYAFLDKAPREPCAKLRANPTSLPLSPTAGN